MKARTTAFLVFLAAALVFAAVSHGFALQATTEQQPGYQESPQTPPTQPGNNPTNNRERGYTSPGNPNSPSSPNMTPGQSAQSDVTPGMGNTQQPVAARRVAWGWLLFGLVTGFIIGALTMGSRRRYRTIEGTRRDDRVA